MIKPTIPHIVWTPERIEEARYWVTTQCLSYPNAAKKMGISKNALLGKCAREGIKQGEGYIRVNKPCKKIPKKSVKPFLKIDLINKRCAFCGEQFKATPRDIKRFCSTRHSYEFHAREKRLALNAAPVSSKKSWLTPPVDSARCHAKGCDTFAVPKHKVCYQHADTFA